MMSHDSENETTHGNNCTERPAKCWHRSSSEEKDDQEEKQQRKSKRTEKTSSELVTHELMKPLNASLASLTLTTTTKKKIDEQLRYSDQELLVKLNTKTNIRTSDIMLRKATPEAKDNVITSLFMIVSDVVVWHYYSNLLYYFSSNPFLRYQVILERNLITSTHQNCAA